MGINRSGEMGEKKCTKVGNHQPEEEDCPRGEGFDLEPPIFKRSKCKEKKESSNREEEPDGIEKESCISPNVPDSWSRYPLEDLL